MAAAVVDLDINEGDSFLMSIEFWSNVDNTIPVDITTDTFTGSFKIGTKQIPMTFEVIDTTTNVLEVSVLYSLMGDLAKSGNYDIDQLNIEGQKYRLMQGRVRINQEVTI